MPSNLYLNLQHFLTALTCDVTHFSTLVQTIGYKGVRYLAGLAQLTLQMKINPMSQNLFVYPASWFPAAERY